MVPGQKVFKQKMDPNCYNVDDKGNVTQYASSTTTTDKEKWKEQKQRSYKETHTNAVEICL